MATDQDPEELSAPAVAERLRSGEPLLLLDVREDWERAIASIAAARHIPMGQIEARLDELPRDCPIVVQCHHGGRSMKVARLLTAQGFAPVYNLQGGIDAWSRLVDPAIPGY
jgi:rhodanese-related sulfurtransferase